MNAAAKIYDLTSYKLRMVIDKEVVTAIWARPVFKDIYEVSFMFNSGGYQLWFVRAMETGGFDPICCSMYQSMETMAIRLKEEMLEEGDKEGKQ